MISEKKAIDIINKYLNFSRNNIMYKYYPISEYQIHHDNELCELLIDYFGDIYVYCGMDKNYDDNIIGDEIQEIIQYLAFWNK